MGRLPEAAETVSWVGAEGGSLAYLLGTTSLELPEKIVIVTADEKRARELGALLSTLHVKGSRAVAMLRRLDYLPFSGMSPSRAHLMDRATLLFRLVFDGDLRFLVLPASCLLDRLTPVAAIRSHCKTLRKGDELDVGALTRFLVEGGYHPATVVSDPGTFARRGGLIDVYFPTYSDPVRIDLWGDEIESLRFFDAESQRTTGRIDEVMLGPVHPILMTSANIERARVRLLDLADDLGIPSKRARSLADLLRVGQLGVGMEDLLPTFYDGLSTLPDYLPSDSLYVLDRPETWREELNARHEGLLAARGRAASAQRDPVTTAESLFVSPDEILGSLGTHAQLVVHALELAGAEASHRVDATSHEALVQLVAAAVERGDAIVHEPLISALGGWVEDGFRVLLFAHQAGGLERLRLILGDHLPIMGEFAAGLRGAEFSKLGPGLYLVLGDIGRGFASRRERLALLDETELFGRGSTRPRSRYTAARGEAFADWRDMREGDCVVHLFHGIGRYLGLERKRVDEVESDFLVLEYADRNRLFVPVDRLHLVSRYRSAENAPLKLDTLGGQRWQRTRSKVRKSTRDIAEQLLRLHAKRKLQSGFAFSPPDATFRSFEATFPFEETPDQSRAIDEIMEDMGAARPMDRLLCGDVGFGKTEVALRATFRAVLDGKQVAVVVPTRVLAQQHLMTFTRRLDPWPMVVGSLTRSASKRENRELLDDLAQGRIDVLIGTHRLLSADVEFRDLGLLILDEEHRFGVGDKEKIKELKADIDVLTMTATPIPRTLHTSMIGLRDLSLIRTPPVDRLAIRTLVARPSDEVIREAIRAELARAGQVFYVHHRVQDIQKHGELVGRLVPEARIAIAHGQMPKGRLEEVMLTFVGGEVDVLVCTTIVESGLDVPRANTMIINGAQRYGLAQLYQLRGRIGRSSQRATCLLLVESTGSLTDKAMRRVTTIQKFVEPGSGFAVASQDMEIRGVGDLLGAEQSGNIHAVGLDTYLDLLAEAVEELRGEAGPVPARIDPELRIALETRIPTAWIPDTVLRLRLYRALARSRSIEEVRDVFESAVDRFGKAPKSARRLVELMELKSLAADLGFAVVTYNSTSLALTLTKHGRLRPELITELLGRAGNRFRLTPGLQLVRSVSPQEWNGELDGLRETLREIWNFVSNGPLRP